MEPLTSEDHVEIAQTLGRTLAAQLAAAQHEALEWKLRYVKLCREVEAASAAEDSGGDHAA